MAEQFVTELEKQAAAAGVTAEPHETADKSPVADTTSAASEEENAERNKKKTGRSISERFSEMAHQRNEARAKAQSLQEELEALKKGKPASEQPKGDDKPKPDDFNTYEEFQEALIDWKTDQKLQSERAREAQEVEQQRVRRNFEVYNRQVASFMAEHEDFEEMVGREDVVVPQVAVTAIYELDNGPAVAYYLATHEEERAKLLDLNSKSLIKVVAEVTRISDRLKGSPEPKRPVTGAPEPIKPVGGTAATSTVPMDKLPFNEFVKAREKQIKDSGRRR